MNIGNAILLMYRCKEARQGITTERIDEVVALVMAFNRAIRNNRKTGSVHNGRE